ncbi:MAG: type II toxin-antitoxin system VapC family toxin [Gammaproteobacteria bacterium]|nr:type II toxin-antitoxin system VapC family toxin [Gammaproteobacteria bacterium]MXY04904.1 type II toxin-antitoxin system VapC family toxin [Gammaproteobacteria bacterium]MYE49892.1 type II toxin-antitoxin system VapC family toxin [Gammaproteobacteria bacterium]MYF11485.1 type II toxin-antitoxin system VapC family toxin [Gammaproteobacteria bacterium]MYG12687.1 type II toxin-antitoxin system VapC family toxin [Gammaproteobacteria bacterium]
MRILVDTHAFIWALNTPERLSPAKRAALESRANTIYLSSISVAEIMIKASLDKLRFDHDPIACAEQLGFELLDFSATDAVLLKDIPFHHRDPFDRMLIAQSLAQNTKLMSDDRRFRRYDCNLL